MTEQDFDQKMHNLLSQAPVPEHNEGFYARFKEVLDAEAPIAGRAPVVAINKRHGVTRRHWYSAIGSAAAVAVALVLVTQTVNTGGSPTVQVALPTTVPATTKPTSTTPPAPAVTQFNPKLASEVIAQAGKSYREFKSVSGVSTTQEGAIAFWADNKGNYGFDSFHVPQGIAREVNRYYVGTGDEVTKSLDASGNVVKTTYATGMSSQNGGVGAYPMSSLLDGLASTNSQTLENTTLDGKPVWKVSAKADHDLIGDSWVAGDYREVVAYFDQTTLMMVREDINGKSLVISNLSVDQDPPAIFDMPDKPINDPATNQSIGWEAGYERLTLAQLRAINPKATALPTNVPEGFVAGPYEFKRSDGLLNVTYHRGLQTFSFGILLSKVADEYYDEGRGYTPENPGPSGVRNPWYQLRAEHAAHDKVQVVGGDYNALQGTYIHGVGVNSNLTVVGATTTMFLGGDLTLDQMKDVAGSVRKQA